MFPYILLVLIILLFYKFKIHSTYSLIFLIIFSSVRYGIGWDYFSYLGTSNTLSEIDLERYGYFWRFLFDIASKFDSDFFVIWISALLTNIMFYYGIRKIFNNNENKVYLSLITYVLYYSFYLSTFSTLRQGLAISLMPLLIYYCTKRSYWKIAIVNIGMIIAHPSAIIVSVLWIPYVLFFNAISYKFLLLISICVVISLQYLSSIITFLFGSSYGSYLDVENSYGGKLLYVNLVLLIFTLSRVNFIKSKQSKLLPYFNLYLVSAIIDMMFRITQSNDIISRILKYGDIMLCVILFNLIATDSKYYYVVKKLIIIFLLILFIAYLNVNIGIKGTGGACYVPYKTIFELRL